MHSYDSFPSELDLDTLVTVTFRDGDTLTGLAGIFNWSLVVSYILAV
jgi:hypothetical protein